MSSRRLLAIAWPVVPLVILVALPFNGLNGFLLVPCVLLHVLLSAPAEPIARRLRQAIIAGAVATLLLLAYVVPLYAVTGRLVIQVASG